MKQVFLILIIIIPPCLFGAVILTTNADIEV